MRQNLYDTLARHITTGDNVVTFNYDVALERALISEDKFHVRSGYGFPVDWPEAESRHQILKLHGSTNWAAFMPAGYGKIEPGESLRLCVDNEDKAFSEYPEKLLDKAVDRVL